MRFSPGSRVYTTADRGVSLRFLQHLICDPIPAAAPWLSWESEIASPSSMRISISSFGKRPACFRPGEFGRVARTAVENSGAKQLGAREATSTAYHEKSTPCLVHRPLAWPFRTLALTLVIRSGHPLTTLRFSQWDSAHRGRRLRRHRRNLSCAGDRPSLRGLPFLGSGNQLPDGGLFFFCQLGVQL
jgi:hypothetical protein